DDTRPSGQIRRVADQNAPDTEAIIRWDAPSHKWYVTLDDDRATITDDLTAARPQAATMIREALKSQAKDDPTPEGGGTYTDDDRTYLLYLLGHEVGELETGVEGALEFASYGDRDWIQAKVDAGVATEIRH